MHSLLLVRLASYRRGMERVQDCLGGAVCGGGFLSSQIAPQVLRLAVKADLSHPLLSTIPLGLVRNPNVTGRIARAYAAVLHVPAIRVISQIFDAVVVPDAVDVVDLNGPFAMVVKPHKAVFVGLDAEEHAVPVSDPFTSGSKPTALAAAKPGLRAVEAASAVYERLAQAANVFFEGWGYHLRSSVGIHCTMGGASVNA